MAATQYVTPLIPNPVVAGVQVTFQVRAVSASLVLDTGYNGTADITSDDPIASFPAQLVFASGLASLTMTFRTVGEQSITLSDHTTPSITGTQSTEVTAQRGWGLDSFGTSPYGGATPGVGIRVLSALAISTNEVQVTLSGPPEAIDPFTPGDALNPSTWTIQRIDTGDFFNPVDVEAFSPTVYGIYVLQPFAPAGVTHQVSTSTLKDTAGNLINPPRSALFDGIQAAAEATIQAQAAADNLAATDLANVQSPVLSTVFGGTLQTTGSGDYASMTGPALVEKLLTRRYISNVRDFFHLANYGAGIQAKAPMTTADLTKLQARLQQQAQLEIEIMSVTVSTSLDSDGVLVIDTNALLAPSGQKLQFLLPVQTAGLVL